MRVRINLARECKAKVEEDELSLLVEELDDLEAIAASGDACQAKQPLDCG